MRGLRDVRLGERQLERDVSVQLQQQDLIDLSLLYNCLAEFIGGTPIQNNFFVLFERLQANVPWLLENPTLDARYAVLRRSRV